MKQPKIVVILVPGARVEDTGEPCPGYKARLDLAVEIYRALPPETKAIMVISGHISNPVAGISEATCGAQYLKEKVNPVLWVLDHSASSIAENVGGLYQVLRHLGIRSSETLLHGVMSNEPFAARLKAHMDGMAAWWGFSAKSIYVSHAGLEFPQSSCTTAEWAKLIAAVMKPFGYGDVLSTTREARKHITKPTSPWRGTLEHGTTLDWPIRSSQ